MVRDYLVLNRGMLVMHWNTNRANDWVNFLDYCKKEIAQGNFTEATEIIIGGKDTVTLAQLFESTVFKNMIF